jgi:GNAT superfamily N-acetyltransferase
MQDQPSGAAGVAPPEIVETSDCDAVARILADAFSADPCFTWVIPYQRLYPAFWRLLATRVYLPHKLVFADTGERAAAMWLPPGVDHKVPMGPTLLLLTIRLLMHSGLGVISRLEQAQEVMDRRHPGAPHYYLHAIGARQDSQGLGLGSALLKEGTRICDEVGMPAYLESSSPRNVPLYERHGFEVTAEEPIGTGGPTLYFMWREPR